MKFKPGQEVTSKIKSNQWKNLLGRPMPLPKFGKIYTVKGYPNKKYPEMMALEEIDGRYLYWENNFEPLVPVEKLEKDLKEVITSVDDIDEELIKRIEEVLKSYE